MSGPSTDARCSIKLCVPPKLVARMNTLVPAATRIAFAAEPFTRNDITPPDINICWLATSYPGCVASPG